MTVFSTFHGHSGSSYNLCLVSNTSFISLSSIMFSSPLLLSLLLLLDVRDIWLMGAPCTVEP